MQTKDVPEKPILLFLKNRGSNWTSLFDPLFMTQFPAACPMKVALSKMKSLVRRGLVDGCTCGCRGDFVLTPKGLESLQ